MIPPKRGLTSRPLLFCRLGHCKKEVRVVKGKAYVLKYTIDMGTATSITVPVYDHTVTMLLPNTQTITASGTYEYRFVANDDVINILYEYKPGNPSSGVFYLDDVSLREDQLPYRFGFNGKETDKEAEGQQDYGMRIYNPKLGKFLSVDPLFRQYPELTTYQFASNMPIWAIDRDGLEAWPVTKQWSYEDRKAFGEFVNGETARVTAAQTEAALKGGGKRMDIEYNCADLAVALYVRYAAVHGLPVDFTSDHTGKPISSQDPKYKFDPNNPQKTIDQFEKDARIGTNAASLVNRGDVVNTPFDGVVAGDLYDSKQHVMMVRNPDADETLGPNQLAIVQASLASSSTNDPLSGTRFLGYDVFPFITAKKDFYRFKELANTVRQEATPNNGSSQGSPVANPQAPAESPECTWCN